MKLAFIGTGNMGGALARAASREKENQLYLVNRHPEKAEKLQKEIGGVVTDLSGAVQAAELIVLGVKPLMLPALCEDIRPLLAARTAPFTVVSMAAGVTVARLREMLGDCPIIRIMPNTPVSVGEGMILYSCPAGVSPDAFLHAMRFAGRFLAVSKTSSSAKGTWLKRVPLLPLSVVPKSRRKRFRPRVPWERLAPRRTRRRTGRVPKTLRR